MRRGGIEKYKVDVIRAGILPQGQERREDGRAKEGGKEDRKSLEEAEGVGAGRVISATTFLKNNTPDTPQPC